MAEVNIGALHRAGTSPREMWDLLTSWGYQGKDLHDDHPWAPDDERLQFDVVCTPRR